MNRVAREVTDEIRRICAENEIELLVVLLPSPTQVPRRSWMQPIDEMAELLGLTQEHIDVLDRLSDRYLVDVEALGIDAIDLRVPFREDAGAKRLYWMRDSHLSLEGHRLAARAMLPWFRSRFPD